MSSNEQYVTTITRVTIGQPYDIGILIMTLISVLSDPHTYIYIYVAAPKLLENLSNTLSPVRT